MKRLSKLRYLGPMAVGWTWYAVRPDSGFGGRDHHVVGVMIDVFGVLAWIGAWVAVLVLIHKMWAGMRGYSTRTDAEWAVKFLFIPVFNLYWSFQVLWGWTRDYNTMVRRKHPVTPRMPEVIALAVCTALVLSVVLVVLADMVSWQFRLPGVMGMILLGVPALILFNRIIDGINAIVAEGADGATLCNFEGE